MIKFLLIYPTSALEKFFNPQNILYIPPVKNRLIAVRKQQNYFVLKTIMFASILVMSMCIGIADTQGSDGIYIDFNSLDSVKLWKKTISVSMEPQVKYLGLKGKAGIQKYIVVSKLESGNYVLSATGKGSDTNKRKLAIQAAISKDLNPKSTITWVNLTGKEFRKAVSAPFKIDKPGNFIIMLSLRSSGLTEAKIKQISIKKIEVEAKNTENYPDIVKLKENRPSPEIVRGSP